MCKVYKTEDARIYYEASQFRCTFWQFKGTLMQIWKFANIFAFIWKYVEDFTLKQLSLFEIQLRETSEKFVYKHSETIKYDKN